MPTLVLLRHGQSIGNEEQRFTGWGEPELSATSFGEGKAAGRLLAEGEFDFDLCFTSLHNRAINTLDLVLAEMDRAWLSVEKHWRLNERHYGALTELYHSEVAAAYSAEQVHIWRRSFDVPPLPVAPRSEWNLSRELRYAGIDIPKSESLKDTIARVLPYWEERIAPMIRGGGANAASRSSHGSRQHENGRGKGWSTWERARRLPCKTAISERLGGNDR